MCTKNLERFDILAFTSTLKHVLLNFPPHLSGKKTVMTFRSRALYFDDEIQTDPELFTPKNLAFFLQFDVETLNVKMTNSKRKYVRCADPNTKTKHQIEKKLVSLVRSILKKGSLKSRPCHGCGLEVVLGG